mgnify:FL=1
MLDDAIDLKPDIPRIKEGLVDVARRRLLTAPDMLDRIAAGLYDDPRIIAHADPHVAILALYPGREEQEVRQRTERYGSPFPNLYTVSGVSKITDPGSYPIQFGNNYLIGHPTGNTIDGGIIFHLYPDCSLTLERMSVRTRVAGGQVLDYPTHLLLLIGFGKKHSLLDAVRDMDDLAVQHVFASRTAADHYARLTQSP